MGGHAAARHPQVPTWDRSAELQMATRASLSAQISALVNLFSPMLGAQLGVCEEYAAFRAASGSSTLLGRMMVRAASAKPACGRNCEIPNVFFGASWKLAIVELGDTCEQQ